MLSMIYVDVDNTLVGTDNHYLKLFGEPWGIGSWQKVLRAYTGGGGPRLYDQLGVPPLARALLRLCAQHAPVTLLTAMPQELIVVDIAKAAWLFENFNGIPAIRCTREDKWRFASPDRLLIDDDARNVKDWRWARGPAIQARDLFYTYRAAAAYFKKEA